MYFKYLRSGSAMTRVVSARTRHYLLTSDFDPRHKYVLHTRKTSAFRDATYSFVEEVALLQAADCSLANNVRRTSFASVAVTSCLPMQ